MQQVHNIKKRMPAILTEDLAWERLFGDLNEERITEVACFQFPAEQMELAQFQKILEMHWNPLRLLFIISYLFWNRNSF